MTGGADHAAFVWAAYGAAALAVAGLIIRAWLDHRFQVRALRRLEAGEPHHG